MNGDVQAPLNSAGTLVPPVPDTSHGGTKGRDTRSLICPVSQSQSEEGLFAIAESLGTGTGKVAKAIWGTFQSVNVSDANGEPANVVDALAHIAKAIYRLAEAVEGIRGPEPASAPTTSDRNRVRLSGIPHELIAPRRNGSHR